MPKIKKLEQELKSDFPELGNTIPEAAVKDSDTVTVSEVKEIVSNFTNSVDRLEHNPCRLERDNCGLLKGLEYEFDSLGFVNYKKLIPREFLVPNRQYFQNKKIPVPESTEGLENNQMIVLLNGYKTLAAIRGFRSVTHKIISASYDLVVIETTIEWEGNYETNFTPVTYTALATASLNNTYSFCKNYLAEIAQNRGECRAIRGFLRIPILASDELGPQNEEDNINAAAQNLGKTDSFSPHAVLQKKLDSKNTPFERFKHYCEGKNIEGAKEWNKIFDIPTGKVLEMIKLMEDREKDLMDKK